MELGLRFGQAVLWANVLHRGDVRKRTDIPYISHLLGVTALVIEHGGDEDQAIAALLHDAIEDTDATYEQIEERFGIRVARIVRECSDAEVAKRENWWYYSQGGPGVYAGDVHYYSFDWDAREDVKRIDTRKCKVALLTGEYDYSCTPAMTEAVAASIPGCRMTIMKGMGHFPMVENYPAFRPFLLPELQFMAAS